MTVKALIALLNNHEEDDAFIDKASESINEAVLVVVIDTQAMVGKFGYAASQMSQGSSALEKCKESLGKKGIKAEDILEWGDTLSKITSMAKLKRVNKIILKKQDNHYFETLVKNLKKDGFEVDVI